MHGELVWETTGTMNEAGTERLNCVEVAPEGPASAAVIWMHGLGADGHDFEPIVPRLGLDDLALRFAFPHASAIPVTLNGGMVMPAWYDITEIDLKRSHDEVGIRRSAAQIEALVARERERGIPADRIVLAGFSQGGAMALSVGLRHTESLAGILAMSTYLVCDEALPGERSEANAETPIFQAHGTLDPMVPYTRGVAARDRLIELGYAVEWRDYPMEHQVCPEEIQDVATWMRSSLKKSP